jgi:hypothetical protein
MSDSPYVQATKKWFEKFVLALNLCPFAHKPAQEGKIRFVMSEARNADQLVRTLLPELMFLYDHEPDEWETTLIVHPHCLNNWDDFWDFLGIVEELIDEAGLTGIFQVVGFHPDYLFGGEEPGDASHFTNHSPFPTMHILREESLSGAVESHPDVEGIPVANVKKLRELGTGILGKKLKELQEL